MIDYNAEKKTQLGLPHGGVPMVDSVFNYVTGVVLRERERLAAIFERAGMTGAAQEILSTKDDDGVFRWVGPGASLANAAAESAANLKVLPFGPNIKQVENPSDAKPVYQQLGAKGTYAAPGTGTLYIAYNGNRLPKEYLGNEGTFGVNFALSPYLAYLNCFPSLAIAVREGEKYDYIFAGQVTNRIAFEKPYGGGPDGMPHTANGEHSAKYACPEADYGSVIGIFVPAGGAVPTIRLD